MKKKVLFAIFSCSLLINFYNMPSSILAYMYESFPDLSQTTVSWIVTIPGLASVAMSFVMGPLLAKISKKAALAGGVALQLLSALIIIFSGGRVFGLVLAGSIISGMVYSVLYTASNAAITEFDSPDQVSKHVSWNYACLYGGIMALIFVSGILAQDGNWVRAYYAYMVAIPVLFYAVAVLPKMEPKKGGVSQTADDSSPKEANVTGGSVITLVLIVVTYVLFWIGSYVLSLNFSSYIITEHHMGTSVEAGTVGTLMSLGAFCATFIADYVIKICRKLTPAVCFILHALLFVAMIYLPNLVVMSVLGFSSGVLCAISSIYGLTVISGSIRKSSTAIGIYSAVPGIGGFVTPYVLSWLNGALNGTFTTKLWIGTVILVIAGIVSVFVMLYAEKTKVRPVEDM